MRTDHTLDPLNAMAAHTLQVSDAPRFLISLFTLGPGEHRITINHPEVEPNPREAWVHVSGKGGAWRAHLSFPSTFAKEDGLGLLLSTVWHHYLLSGGVLHEAKTFEETLPTRFDVTVEVQALAAGTMAVEDLCDACALPRDPALRGAPPPVPLESDPPPS